MASSKGISKDNRAVLYCVAAEEVVGSRKNSKSEAACVLSVLCSPLAEAAFEDALDGENKASGIYGSWCNIKLVSSLKPPFPGLVSGSGGASTEKEGAKDIG